MKTDLEPVWRSYSGHTDSSVARLAIEEATDAMAEMVDACNPTGRNNYWEPTSALGAGWNKSGLKWKWQCKLDGSNALMCVPAETVEADKAGMGDKEDINLRLRRKLPLEKREVASRRGEVLISAGNRSVAKKWAHPESHMDTWVMDEVPDRGLRDDSATVAVISAPPTGKKPKFNFGIFPTNGAAITSDKPFGSDNKFAPGKATPRFGLPGLTDHQKLGTRNVGTSVQDYGHESNRSIGRGHLQPEPGGAFRTAGHILAASYGVSSTSSFKTLGVNKPPAALQSAFKPPISGLYATPVQSASAVAAVSSTEEILDERLKGIDAKMIELIRNEIMDNGSCLDWSDIAGLEFVKSVIQEIVVFPMLRPDIFKGLKAPPKGLLLFGPPGTGKTLIGKCIASRSKSTFFAISASSLTSKWVGESEKMVRALFAVARVHQPSVVFIDEIDSLLTARSDSENESSRRLKTEFLVQLDGASTEGEERILIVGATNRPQDLDEAARRRLVKRLYVPLPEAEGRRQIIENLMTNEKHSLSMADKSTIVDRTQGYSGADVTNLCRDAAIGPIRGLDFSAIENISNEDIRPIGLDDFINALRQVRASVSDKDLNSYVEWDRQFGSGK